MSVYFYINIFCTLCTHQPQHRTGCVSLLDRREVSHLNDHVVYPVSDGRRDPRVCRIKDRRRTKVSVSQHTARCAGGA